MHLEGMSSSCAEGDELLELQWQAVAPGDGSMRAMVTSTPGAPTGGVPSAHCVCAGGGGRLAVGVASVLTQRGKLFLVRQALAALVHWSGNMTSLFTRRRGHDELGHLLGPGRRWLRRPVEGVLQVQAMAPVRDRGGHLGQVGGGAESAHRRRDLVGATVRKKRG